VTITRIHSFIVWLFLAATIVFAVRLSRLGGGPQTLVRVLLATIAGQGALGYLQYVLGVPAVLVEAHVLGAVVVWCLTIAIYLGLAERPALDDGGEDPRLVGGVQNNRPEAVTDRPRLDRMKV
jgi:cytochrome c oxidase assembly protein subunit 15